MASTIQIRNQENSRSSTGPRTVEGKAISSQNALRHGLTGTQVVVPGEDPEAFREHVRALTEELDPDDPVQRLLVEQVTTASWRLKRIPRLEADLLAPMLDAENAVAPKDVSTSLGWSLLTRERAFATLQRYEASLDRQLHRALHELERRKAAKAGEAVQLPMALDVDVAVATARKE